MLDRYVSAITKEEFLIYENEILIKSLLALSFMLAVTNATLLPQFGAPLMTCLYESAVFAGLGFYLLFVYKVVNNQNTKTILIIIALALFLAFIIVEYYAAVGLVVWVIAAALLMTSMWRDDQRQLIVITVVLIILLFYTYFMYPGSVTLLQAASLSIVYVCMLAVAFVIKKINSKRFELVSQQLLQSTVISRLSSQMIGLNILNANAKISQFLKDIGAHYKIDRIGIMLLSQDGETLSYAYEWCSPGIAPAMGKLPQIKVTGDSWWSGQLTKRALLVISDIAQDKELTPRARAIMTSLGIKSLMSIPILVGGTVYGFFVNHTVITHNAWRDDQKNTMTVLANILSDAFIKLESEKEINRMAYYDALTGLPNRFLFNSTVDNALLAAAEAGEKLAVLFIDLDSFKAVNDTMGHEGGDRLLRQVAHNLAAHLSPDDFAARFGGDEFIVLLSHIDSLAQLETRVSEIMATFNQPIMVSAQEFFVSATGGVALFPDDGGTRDSLIKNADLAMYSAKEDGKNQYKLCTAEMKNAVEKRVLLTNMLYKALENNELVLHYQPQVSVATKQIVGLEALLRWQNPELGLIPPGVFIPLAEQSGLINPIGHWVLETACRQNKLWQEKGLPPVRMAVNLSIEQFRNPILVDMILKVLKETGLEAKYLELEITESIAIKETTDVVPVLTALKDHGITISIDDFGTDYSSLARIKNLPIDRIKMAMEFVHGITVSDKDEAIAMVIITLANKLGLGVIAEGVETDTQLSFLEKRICDEVQGYYFYKPMPAEDIEKLLMS